MRKRGLRIGGHPVHPGLTDLPIGLFIGSLILDIVFLSTGDRMWWTFSFWTIAAGVVLVIPTAVTGLIDLLAVPRGHPAVRIGVYHLVANVSATALLAIGWFFRRADAQTVAYALSWVGIGVLLIGGWLGGSMVFRHGIGTEAYARGEEKPEEALRRPLEKVHR
ncbi:MAG: DUF2231 domain-containing protein [Planctomycetes bacterium]|nr:DUF2231 domain-containing protein [Planctomycetota bacterium]